MCNFGIISFQIIFLILCESKKGYGPGEQDWNYVDIRFGAHMFYWLHYTSANVSHYTERPLVLWVNGGPGTAGSGVGNFIEVGPIDFKGNPRNYTFVKDFNLLLIDSPVGTGYSYVDIDLLYSKDSADVGRDMIALMKAFYTDHPEFKNVDLHLFCESYGGKFCLEFALELKKVSKRKEIPCKLKTLNMGDPFITTKDLLPSYAPYLYETGLIDKTQYDDFEKRTTDILNLMNANLWLPAALKAIKFIELMCNATKGIQIYDIRQPVMRTENPNCVYSIDNKPWYNDFMNGPVASALNIPSKVVFNSQQEKVQWNLLASLPKSVVPIVEELLNTSDIKISVYAGTADLLAPISGTQRWINNMRWPQKQKYLEAPRNGFYVDNVLKGYVKRFGKFAMYWVLTAGHLVATEDPKTMLHIARNIIDFD